MLLVNYLKRYYYHWENNKLNSSGVTRYMAATWPPDVIRSGVRVGAVERGGGAGLENLAQYLGKTLIKCNESPFCYIIRWISWKNGRNPFTKHYRKGSFSYFSKQPYFDVDIYLFKRSLTAQSFVRFIIMSTKHETRCQNINILMRFHIG